MAKSKKKAVKKTSPKRKASRISFVLSYFRGFTLPELLIALSIVAVLVVFGLSFLRAGQARARDATRKSDLRKIQLAVEEYEKDNDYYPAQGLVACASTSLAPYLNTVPCDPLDNSSYAYVTDGTATSDWYGLYASFEDDSNAELTAGIGPGGTYNYYVASANADTEYLLRTSLGSSPSPTPTATATSGGGSEPTPTPAPTATPVATPNYANPNSLDYTSGETMDGLLTYLQEQKAAGTPTYNIDPQGIDGVLQILAYRFYGQSSQIAFNYFVQDLHTQVYNSSGSSITTHQTPWLVSVRISAAQLQGTATQTKQYLANKVNATGGVSLMNSFPNSHSLTAYVSVPGLITLMNDNDIFSIVNQPTISN